LFRPNGPADRLSKNPTRQSITSEVKDFDFTDTCIVRRVAAGMDVQRIEETSHLAGHKPAGRQQRVNVERLAG
jgi:hypothetical protein